jgi:hypothetical protein
VGSRRARRRVVWVTGQVRRVHARRLAPLHGRGGRREPRCLTLAGARASRGARDVPGSAAQLNGGFTPVGGARRPRALPGRARRAHRPADLALMTERTHESHDRACEDARRRASLALDGALRDDVGLRLLRSHLDACPACTRFVAGMRLATSSLRRAPPERFHCELPGARLVRLPSASPGLPWATAAVDAPLAPVVLASAHPATDWMQGCRSSSTTTTSSRSTATGR